MNRAIIEEATRLLLTGLGVDPTDHNFANTPKRVADVYNEMFEPHFTGYPVFDEDYTDLVVMAGHQFYTMCPHHLLPVKLVASVGYIPDGKVIGASKLMRMIHECNTYPRTQEALTAAIVKKIDQITHGTSRGCAVTLTGKHGCFEIRGVRSPARMVTMKFTGEFEKNADLQTRFLRMVHNGE